MYHSKERIFAFLILITLIFSFFTIYVASEETPKVSARAAALYEPESKSFLYDKNSDERLPMASTTKIMTALIALEQLELDAPICVDDRAIGVDGSSVYLVQGEVMSAEGLIFALMLRSANDAAEALAYEIAGGIEEFCALMNERAHELGLTDTNFENPHGLDADNHYTTAHDLALITAEALKNEKFREISSSYKKEITSSEQTRLLVNHNKLLKMYDGCIGVKTGYTKKSGRSLVGAAEKDGLTLISVTINAPDDWNDHKEMLDYGFSTTHVLTLIDEGEYVRDLPVLSGIDNTVTVKNRDKIKIIYTGNMPKIDTQVRLSRYAAAPVSEGDVLGTITFYHGEKAIAKTDIIATDSTERKEKRSIFGFLK
ncbi:MAG: D-alanyl-D-alanine carboxypeptidase [Clostridia bacterium]|nr:D-alanyl-D-alanine carboxypeptidase [Clostridia bacterium]